MSPAKNHGRDTSDRPPKCAESACVGNADFFVYDADAGKWRAICTPHARHRHPSLEIHAWLESGYMKPVELGKPEGEPPEPPGERGNAFRREVEETMNWSG